MNFRSESERAIAATELSVIIPTHNGDPARLRRVLLGLTSQTLPASRWETVLVDNVSSPPVAIESFPEATGLAIRVCAEKQLGLTHARKRGFVEARGALCVLVDDDNVLAPDYLAQAVALAARHPAVGAFGGRSVPEFERLPEDWKLEFFDLLAVRDLGPAPIIAGPSRSVEAGPTAYPNCAPIGAGMVIRRDLAVEWCRVDTAMIADRQGAALSSGGDNDLVFFVLTRGAGVAYFPELSLTHLIPASRLESSYLGRLNRGIQQSWMQVLSKYAANPWPPIRGWTVPLRQAKAWFVHRAWTSPAHRVRWEGACGHFEGRVPARGASHS